jgi:hypothetical protein
MMAKDIELPVGERASVFLAIVVCQRQQPSARTRHAHEHCVTIKRRSNRNRGCYSSISSLSWQYTNRLL